VTLWPLLCHCPFALAIAREGKDKKHRTTVAQADLNMTNIKPEKSFRTINQKFSSYLAGLFEGDGCI
jgi:hypothetical protein